MMVSAGLADGLGNDQHSELVIEVAGKGDGRR